MALTDKLTAIADAIRSKTGRTEPMTLDQMATEIAGIQSGGGGGEIAALFDKTITDVNSNATTIPDSVFRECKDLVSAEFPNATKIGGSAFQLCTQLRTIDFPMVESIGNNCFYGCTNISGGLRFPLLTALGQRVFQGCQSALKSIDLPKVTSIDAYAFYENRVLVAVILRSETVCTLKSPTGFGNCWAIQEGTGWFYVPRALIPEYRVATNFSAFANQFRALEDYTVDGTITGDFDYDKAGVVL